MMSKLIFLDVGCWRTPRPGYIGLDNNPDAKECADGDHIVLWDVLAGLPFEDAAVAEVRGDQFIEHLTLEQLRDFLAECHRVLVVGGEVRFEFPDIGACAAGGLEDHFVSEQGLEIEGIPDELVMLNLLTHQWGHQCILTLQYVLPLFEQHFEIKHAATFGPNALIIGRKSESR
jgi:predicted SAM-dependent methyltransferase